MEVTFTLHVACLATPTPWVCRGPTTPPPAPPRLRLFCFPPMATGAHVFQGWPRGLPAWVDVVPVELPGRNTRSAEPAVPSMEALAAQAVDALAPLFGELPFALFGHSMGAWLAYEVASVLRRRGLPAPLKLYVSANRAPHLHRVEEDVDPTAFSRLDGAQFWQAFERRYGVNPMLQMPQVRDFVYPTMKVDFQAIESYVPSDLQPLPFPIAACGGSDDTRYTKEQLQAWRQHTTAAFSEHWFPGGHKYVIDDPAPLLQFLSTDLSSLPTAL